MAELAEVYKVLAPNYDQSYQHPCFIAEDMLTYGTLLGVGNLGYVLEVCCGTGASLTFLPLEPNRYMGIDQSSAMLERALSKFPQHLFLERSIEKFQPPYGIDTILCLYTGYIHADVIHKLFVASGAKRAFVHVFNHVRVNTEIAILDKQMGLEPSPLKEWKALFNVKYTKINAYPQRKNKWGLRRYICSLFVEEHLPIPASKYAWLLLDLKQKDDK